MPESIRTNPAPLHLIRSAALSGIFPLAHRCSKPEFMFVASNIDCHRGKTRVLSGVSFSLSAGDCLIVQGPNGSGKTTLLRTLAGLSAPGAGTLAANMDEIVYCGHLDAVKPQLTVQENLTFWQDVYQLAPPNVPDIFEFEDLLERPAATLSAGQSRRLGLARMLVSGRSIWLLDEPTKALDSHYTDLFVNLLQDHCKNGGIAVLSSHLTLNIPGAKILNVAQFAAFDTFEEDPFLEGFI